MLYVRFCRQNLSPTPQVSPVPQPTGDLLAVYEKYTNLNDALPFDPKALREHLGPVIPVFAKHMTDEIETLSKEKIAQVGQKEYGAIDGRLRVKLQAYGPEWFLCIVFGQSFPIPLPARTRKTVLTSHSGDADENLRSAFAVAFHRQKCPRPGEHSP